MMMPTQAHAAQVRRANLTDEIPDAISFGGIRLYRSGCQEPGREPTSANSRALDPGPPDHDAAFARGGELPMATGPTVRRRRLGTELRRLRESSGYKLEEVAGILGVAPSTLSRIETGKAPTKSAYLNQMLEMYGVIDPQQRQVLVDMAREGHRKGWWADFDDVLPSGFDI